MPDEIPTLIYRGNFSCAAGIDFAGTMLAAEFGGGYRTDEVVMPPLRYWSFTYSALSRRVNVQPPNAEPIDRLSYIWNFYYQSKLNGNRPFKVRCPRDNKLYLAYWPDGNLEMSLADQFLATTGLQARQLYMRGVNTLPDGSLDEGVENSDTI